MAPQEFVPVPPAGFDIAGSFNGVTTAVGSGGLPRVRYQLTGTQFRSGGVIGFATRQVLKTGVGDEVALGSLHTRCSFALLMVGVQPEVGVIERTKQHPAAAVVLGRYLDRSSSATRYGAMALVKGSPGMIEILVTECDSEDASRQLVQAAMQPYL